MLLFTLPDILQTAQLFLKFTGNKLPITQIPLPPALKVLSPHNPSFCTAWEAEWGWCIPRKTQGISAPSRAQRGFYHQQGH